jgi:hypothetical protein
MEKRNPVSGLHAQLVAAPQATRHQISTDLGTQ